MGIKLRVDGVCGTILLEQSSRGNALDRQMIDNLIQAFDDLNQEAKVRAVILTGAGDYFSTGTDLHELHGTRELEQHQQLWFEDVERQRRLLVAMLQFPKPIIAAVNGPALGLGAGLIVASDLAVTAETAVFGFPESLRGLSPGLSIPLVVHRLGAARASQLLLSGQTIDARSAVQMGLVNETVPFELVWARSAELAKQISLTSPVAQSMSKRILNETVGEQLNAQLAAAAAAMATARTTDHAVEGVGAFLEKRVPDWDKSQPLE